MFPKLSLAARALRCYSSTGGSQNSSFLSDLMKKIDVINQKTDSIAVSKKSKEEGLPRKKTFVRANQPSKQSKSSGQKNPSGESASPNVSVRANKLSKQSKSSGQKNPSGESASPNVSVRANKPSKQSKSSSQKNPSGQSASPNVSVRASSFVSTTSAVRITVKDHPLSSNAFKLMDEKNFRRSDSTSGSRSSQKNLRPQVNRPESGPKKRANTKAAGQRRDNKTSRTAAHQSIVRKDVQSKPLAPGIGADLFLYGKPAKLAISTSSRVAAVAKETLLKSHYPYKLPKSIIDGLDSSFTGNKFILQKDFDTSVDPSELEERIRKVVRGETDKLVTKSDRAEHLATARVLMRNGSLDMDQKQTIYDVASGLKSAQSLLSTAAWNQ